MSYGLQDRDLSDSCAIMICFNFTESGLILSSFNIINFPEEI